MHAAAPPVRPRRTHRSLVATLLVAIVTLVACVASVPSAAHSQPTTDRVAAVLSIENQRFYDITISIERDGTTVRRIGFAPGFTTTNFVLVTSDAPPGAMFRLRGHAIGTATRDDYVSDPMPFVLGALYTWPLIEVGRGRGTIRYREQSSDGEIVALDEPPNPSAAAPLDSTCRAPGCRSSAVARLFARLTGFAPKKGWIKDHMVPLQCGGADVPENIVWLTVAEAAYKDRVEDQCWRWTPRVRSDSVPPPNATPPASGP